MELIILNPNSDPLKNILYFNFLVFLGESTNNEFCGLVSPSLK
jgi:hypothetical protein